MTALWWLILAVIAFGGAGLAVAQSIPSGSQTPAVDGGSDASSADLFNFGGNVSTITNDPTTWPGNESDPIAKCCHAIALAEGYNVAGSNPNRLNNPGDISDGAGQFGSESHSGSNVTHFPDPETGWQWLYDKVARIVAGESSVYSPDSTWGEISRKWAGNWQPWVKTVTRYMQVGVNDRFGNSFGV